MAQRTTEKDLENHYEDIETLEGEVKQWKSIVADSNNAEDKRLLKACEKELEQALVLTEDLLQSIDEWGDLAHFALSDFEAAGGNPYDIWQLYKSRT